MTKNQTYALHSLALSNEDVTRNDRPDTFTRYGKEWDLLDEVFAPIYRPSSDASVEFLDLLEPGRFKWSSMLEIGSGTGIVSILAALAGCERVVAADINPSAVENTKLNAKRHGVADRVTVVESDLFGSLAEHERFDLIFWNSNFIWVPDEYDFKSVHEQAFADPGYRAHRRFMLEATDWLTETGSVQLLFSSSKGDIPALYQLAEETDRTLRILRSKTVQDGTDMARSEYLLIDVAAAS